MKNFIIILAIVCIAMLQVVAFVYQIDGRTLALCIATIAGLGGYEIGIRRRK